jgi:hypothetical protein
MGPTMIRHFGPTVAIQGAIVEGDLPAAQRAAENLLFRLQHESHPSGWEPALQEVRTAAQDVTKASTIETAAKATARLGYACGKCHDNLGVPFSDPANFLITTPPADLTQAMHRHLQAADDLWLSLVTASNDRWLTGARNLAHSSLFPMEDNVASPEVRDLATRFHALAGVAQTTEWSAERADLYGELLGTCARCHRLVQSTAAR